MKNIVKRNFTFAQMATCAVVKIGGGMWVMAYDTVKNRGEMNIKGFSHVVRGCW